MWGKARRKGRNSKIKKGGRERLNNKLVSGEGEKRLVRGYEGRLSKRGKLEVWSVIVGGAFVLDELER